MSTPGLSEPAAGPVYANVLEMIGATPMLELKSLDTGPCRLFGKMELNNPAGSIKDRIGLSMIEGAEREGLIDPTADPKPTIVEATAGNTGIGLALVAGQRGYRLIVVMPDKMSQEKVQHLRAMGAEVVMTRSDVMKGHPEYYQEVAARIARDTPNSYFINQFANPHNPEAHLAGTGPEIVAQVRAATGADPDAFVCGVGSGGTLAGAGRFIKAHAPGCAIVLADPAGSILAPLVNEGKAVEPGAWLVEGMGEDFVPDICDLDLVDEAIAVADKDSFLAARELLRAEGVLAGSSTGCILHAALAYCRRQTTPKNVVALICDSGAKYLSKMFNDYWMMDNGFLERETFGDLRDLIARRHGKQEDFVVKPTDPVGQAYKTMRLHDVSQLAVVDPADRDSVVGIIDEGDILLAVTAGRDAFDKPVADFMTTRLETIAPGAPVQDLLPIFRADRVAIVVDERGTYLGLITKIDLINYLRRSLPESPQPA
ncbi:MAG: pyridoxal-phosphate dependent enzyme [Planctomycetota bacterium]|nr:MAG: pyridoxal-phosphate dependent enzyme [Planctomycetota bacterium]